MGSTQAEKILARASGKSSVTPGDHVVCNVDLAMSHDMGTYKVVDPLEEMGVDQVWDPSKIVIPMDHEAPSHTIQDATGKTKIRKFVEEQGIENFYEVGNGISHTLLPEKGHVRPGMLIVGGDSHTTSLGTFGAASTGLGTTEMAYVMATGRNWFRVPESIRFEVTGTMDDRVSSKDLILHIAGTYGTDVGLYRAIEYGGPVVEALDIDDRFTLPNMSIELGAKYGFTPVDEKVTEYVEARSDEPFTPARPDEDAEYAETYEIDMSDIGPKVSKPHRVGNVVDVDDVTGTDLDQVFIGSCTNGKYRDLEVAADILDGNEVSSDLRMIITPATREIYSRAVDTGLVEIFNDAGAIVTNATCGACIGRGMGVIGEDEVCLAAQNRNFQGRMGHDSSEVYLSSPQTAAASAVTGHIADPREV